MCVAIQITYIHMQEAISILIPMHAKCIDQAKGLTKHMPNTKKIKVKGKGRTINEDS